MKRIAVVSDTHLSSTTLPAWVKGEIRRADRTIHAGDVDTSQGIDQMRDLSNNAFTIAQGNWDKNQKTKLPVAATVEIENVCFVVTHGTTGKGNNYIQRLISVIRKQPTETNRVIGIGGHTHQVMDTTVSGIRLLNPGSATGAYPAKTATMMSIIISDGQLSAKVLGSPE